ncbi:hypothetical protein TSAR_010425 [Trichomalopsis sarcophagae]|uniref:Uncharacterized protein n=1 Tax=Trichomalopsis sarcophagae TaxID=543379 RepID=A0A232FJQ0_9HYME|nr:hypothetical protein TSAR_010425 [Trichomalopsis sarcophagae]
MGDGMRAYRIRSELGLLGFWSKMFGRLHNRLLIDVDMNVTTVPIMERCCHDNVYPTFIEPVSAQYQASEQNSTFYKSYRQQYVSLKLHYILFAHKITTTPAYFQLHPRQQLVLWIHS